MPCAAASLQSWEKSKRPWKHKSESQVRTTGRASVARGTAEAEEKRVGGRYQEQQILERILSV